MSERTKQCEDDGHNTIKNVRTIIHIPKTGSGTNKVVIPTEIL